MLDDNTYEYGYGFFPGGDPRDFTPDYDLCTEDEIKAWQRDVLAWNMGVRHVPCPPSCTHIEAGTTHIVITAPRYGIGIYRVRQA